MSDPQTRLRYSYPQFRARPRPTRPPLGRYLVENGVISPTQLIHALNQQLRVDAPLGEILVSEGLADEDVILDTVALQHDAQRVNLTGDLPEPDLFRLMPPAFWARHQIVPWLRLGRTLLVATSRPDRLKTLQRSVPHDLGTLMPVVAPAADIAACLSRSIGTALAHRAENRVRDHESCRNWTPRARGPCIGLAVAGLVFLIALTVSPAITLFGLSLVAIVTLVLSTGLKAAAFCAQMIARLPAGRATDLDDSTNFRLPQVSVIVPLLGEKEIAQALIRRLSRLTYPKALLDVVLVLEARDDVTRRTLSETKLPAWMKVIEVPHTGGVTTKPRALNYALDFCRGSIIGVWDAEDAPDPGQIEAVTSHLNAAPPSVACVQGILDYYNPRTNWISRCFTVEYATWWRIIMPGIARLGLVIPLGGTTLFFRRDALEKLQGWDAHNVTEDADLGIRLARYGYRTELIPTVTHEEATCRPWPWIRQRSRWLKGFMVTYLVHMRRPRHLLSELGPFRFWGFQIFFLSALSQFILAPLLWSFWLVLFGLPHPFTLVLGTSVLPVLAAVFLTCEAISIGIGLVAVSGREHRHLLGWVPTLLLYFPMGAVASYKALYELVARPFFWDKTQHGHSLRLKPGR